MDGSRRDLHVSKVVCWTDRFAEGQVLEKAYFVASVNNERSRATFVQQVGNGANGMSPDGGVNGCSVVAVAVWILFSSIVISSGGSDDG